MQEKHELTFSIMQERLYIPGWEWEEEKQWMSILQFGHKSVCIWEGEGREKKDYLIKLNPLGIPELQNLKLSRDTGEWFSVKQQRW